MPTLLADGREFAISDEAWSAWKDAARPFELPDDVLRRVFRAELHPTSDMTAPSSPDGKRPVPGSRRGGRSRIASDLLLPESEYEVPILRAIAAAGGRRPTREVIDEVGRELDGRLTEADREPLRDGGPPRWQNRVQFARLRLVKSGFMKADSPRGVWEISPKGEDRIRMTS